MSGRADNPAARRGDARWLVSQLQDLAYHLDGSRRSVDEVRRDLLAIAAGQPWREACAQRRRR